MLGRSALGALLAAVAALAPVPARAQSPISFNHIVTNNLPFGDCLYIASDVLRSAGLRQFGTTSEAVWGETDDRRHQVSVYCLSTRDVVVITVVGDDRSRNAWILDNVMAAWRRRR